MYKKGDIVRGKVSKAIYKIIGLEGNLIRAKVIKSPNDYYFVGNVRVFSYNAKLELVKRKNHPQTNLFK